MQQDVKELSQEKKWEEHLAAIKKAHLLTDEDGLISGGEAMQREWEAFKQLLTKVYGKLRGLCGCCEEEAYSEEESSEGSSRTERESETTDRVRAEET